MNSEERLKTMKRIAVKRANPVAEAAASATVRRIGIQRRCSLPEIRERLGTVNYHYGWSRNLKPVTSGKWVGKGWKL